MARCRKVLRFADKADGLTEGSLTGKVADLLWDLEENAKSSDPVLVGGAPRCKDEIAVEPIATKIYIMAT